MDAIGVLIVGAGLWLIYAAYKGKSPWQVVKKTIAAETPGTTAGTKAA